MLSGYLLSGAIRIAAHSHVHKCKHDALPILNPGPGIVWNSSDWMGLY